MQATDPAKEGMVSKMILVLALLVLNVSDVSGPVEWGTVSVSAWEALQEAGWQGDPTDGIEALYHP